MWLRTGADERSVIGGQDAGRGRRQVRLLLDRRLVLPQHYSRSCRAADVTEVGRLQGLAFPGPASSAPRSSGPWISSSFPEDDDPFWSREASCAGVVIALLGPRYDNLHLIVRYRPRPHNPPSRLRRTTGSWAIRRSVCRDTSGNCVARRTGPASIGSPRTTSARPPRHGWMMPNRAIQRVDAPRNRAERADTQAALR